MGPEASKAKAEKIDNQTAKTIFLNFVECCEAQPNDIKTSKGFKQMVIQFYNSCKAQEASARYLSLEITGKNLGPAFIQIGLNFLKMYPMITSLSLRGSSLKTEHASPIAQFIQKSSSLKQLELSENHLGAAGVNTILRAAVGHPRLEALLLDNNGTDTSITPALVAVISAKSNLNVLRLQPTTLNAKDLGTVSTALRANGKLHILNLDQDPHSTTVTPLQASLNRNNQIHGIIEELVTCPWHRTFKMRNTLYKSVKGRKMAEGRVQQLQSMQGTRLYDLYSEAQAHAEDSTPANIKAGSGNLRIGAAETLGRRETMEDFTLLEESYMGPESALIGLFDGHGGREASEYVGKNIMSVLDKHKEQPIEPAITQTLKELQDSVKDWCRYVGTTVGLAIVTTQRIVVANLGDTRVVLIEGDKVTRLSVDHKPSDEDERKFLEQHGAFVEEGRVNGTLAVSRAIGDGILGEALNVTPHIQQVPITENSILIVACDGVWDVIGDEQAADIVRAEIDPELAARKLRDAAFSAGSTDNISVIVASIQVPIADTD